MKRRVAVVGEGIVSSIGHDPGAVVPRLRVPRNCVAASGALAAYKGLRTRLWAPCGYVRPERYTRKTLRTMSPVSEMALFAAEAALAQAGLAGDEAALKGGRLGVAFGSCSGGVEANLDFATILADREVKNVTSATYLKMMPQTAAVNLSVHFGTTGRLLPSGTACTSGSLAIGEAYEAIAYGKQDMMIAGGAEEFSVTQVAVFDTLFSASCRNDAPEAVPRPFDRDRDGLVVGDGAAVLVLEEWGHALARGARPLAEIAGFGTNTDGRHVTQPSAETMARALSLALEDAGLPPQAIGYVNAHGTATALGDAAEGAATQAVFGRNAVPVSTVKSYTGHTLGACGAIEAVATIEMMRAGWFAPNLNLRDPDPACGENDFIAGEGRAMDVEYAMSDNFAFGGVNTSIVFRKP